MINKHIDENEFSPAPGGSNGTLNYQAGYGTQNYASQDPDHFEHSDNNKAVNQNSDINKNSQDSGSMEKNIDALYAPSKKITPTADEIICGIKFELSHQIKKDKRMAKEQVIKNLKKNPKYYSSLGMLNIDDAEMVKNMTENKHPNDSPARNKVTANVDETKKIFAEMKKGHDNKYVVNSGIVDVMKQMWQQKNDRKLGSK